MIYLRSTLFFILAVITTSIYGIITVPMAIMSQRIGYACARSWGTQIVMLARVICGMKFEIKGAANMPTVPVVIMAKHQSAWETVAILSLAPRSAWIIKRELVLLPFVGWALASLRSIAIDRKSGKGALEQILEQGKERIAGGLCVVVFPEGTRVAPGARKRYGIGGASLATHTGAPVVPMAHNAGELWRRNAFLKYPGTITLSIGPLISSSGKEPGALTSEVENWIENEMAQLPPAVRR